MKSATSSFRTLRLWVLVPIIALVVFGCNGGGNVLQTDTGKGALIGGGSGALIGALIDSSNPWTGALLGAAGGALAGGLIGNYMDQRKQDLTKALAPEINAGQAQVQLLADSSLLITMTQRTAFALSSAVIAPGFLTTLQKIANVVSTYGRITISVIGHPDAQGTYAEKETLAYQRAEAVRIQLIGLGVSPALVSASGNPNSSYLDGRVELVLSPLRSG